MALSHAPSCPNSPSEETRDFSPSHALKPLSIFTPVGNLKRPSKWSTLFHCTATAEIDGGVAVVREKKSSEVEDEVLVPVDEETEQERVASKYDWREEWYPLYLTQQVPEDAPLGLNVFDKHLVLYRDGGGVLRCYEDRCPPNPVFVI